MSERNGPTYVVKGRHGDVMVEGDAATVRKWLDEARITSRAEMRRKGIVLYEEDTAWAVLDAFPEFAGPSAFAAVSQRARVAKWCLGAAIILTLVALAGLWFAQGYPRYDASRQIEAARVAQVAAERAAEASRAAELRSKAAEESARRDQAQADARLKAGSAAYQRLSNDFDGYRRRLPVYVVWGEAFFGSYKVMKVHNLSSDPVELLVSVWRVDGTQTKWQYPMKLAPYGEAGFIQETGRRERVSHEFTPGEAAELTDVGQGKKEQYLPAKFVCPR